MAVRRWSHAREAEVVVAVEVTRDRYMRGELVVRAKYRYPDGSTREGDSHRVALGPGARRAVPRIWDMLFDEVLRVQDERPRSVTVSLDTSDMNGWQERIVTVARLVAHELRVPVKTA